MSPFANRWLRSRDSILWSIRYSPRISLSYAFRSNFGSLAASKPQPQRLSPKSRHYSSLTKEQAKAGVRVFVVPAARWVESRESDRPTCNLQNFRRLSRGLWNDQPRFRNGLKGFAEEIRDQAGSKTCWTRMAFMRSPVRFRSGSSFINFARAARSSLRPSLAAAGASTSLPPRPALPPHSENSWSIESFRCAWGPGSRPWHLLWRWSYRLSSPSVQGKRPRRAEGCGLPGCDQ